MEQVRANAIQTLSRNLPKMENYDKEKEMAEWELIQMYNFKSPSTQNYFLIAPSIRVTFF